MHSELRLMGQTFFAGARDVDVDFFGTLVVLALGLPAKTFLGAGFFTAVVVLGLVAVAAFLTGAGLAALEVEDFVDALGLAVVDLVFDAAVLGLVVAGLFWFCMSEHFGR